MAVPTPMPVMAMPAVPAMPMAVVPAVVPVMAPAHLFGFEAVDFVRAGHGGTQVFIDGRRPLFLRKRLRRQRRGLRARSKHGCAGGGGKGEFEKMAAFHDISLFVRGQ